MLRGQSPPLVDGKLPIFVFPNHLNFHSDDQTSHKQVLTLYNPYDFTLKFKVLSTSPHKYSVVDSEGSIKARCCVDIVIRHKDISVRNEGVRDKFRVQVCEQGSNAVIGRKDVPSALLPTKEQTPQAEETFESLPSVLSSREQQQSFQRPSNGVHGPSWLIISVALLCIAALMLPCEGDEKSRIPSYLHLNHQQKLIAAYILGLLTMAVMRS